ncbi:MAG: glutathione peroxidase [Paludibacteraceae bacterium]
MKPFILLTTFIFLLSCSSTTKHSSKSGANDIYAFKAVNMQGKETGLDEYKGKVVVIVNTASKCGYTKQFDGLEALYKNHKDDGLVILGFPTNQFGKQDPGTNQEILEFCTANYGVTFPMFEKIEVNGENAHPLYQYLKSNVPNTETEDIKWNFNKFLIGKDGKPVKRYDSKVTPEEMEQDILSVLKR